MSALARPGAPGVEITEFAMLLYEFMERLRGEHEEAAASASLTPAQATLLTLLSEPTSMRNLATRMGCDPSNITGIVDRLEDKGLVERLADPSDRRVKQIAPTQAGRDTVARFQDQLVHLSSLAKLNPDARQGLLAILRQTQNQPTD
ncbi:MAG: MarR family winged helix-turn-helix transcriptional regulator [Egibacteraceae bacterium]